MCESCSPNFNRREFVVGGSLAASLVSVSLLRATEAADEADEAARDKTPALVKAVFLYPLSETYDEGNQWHPYPGRYFGHAEQQQKFAEHIGAMAERIGMRIEVLSSPLTDKADADRYIAEAGSAPSDATLIVCLSNASINDAHRISQEVEGPAIVYLPTGATHGRPPAALLDAERVHFIYSVENWAEIERSLRAVHAKKMLAQARVLRVGKYDSVAKGVYGRLGTEVISLPAEEYNDLFDSIKPDDAIAAAAMQFKGNAVEVTDITDHYFVEAFRAHQAVGALLERYDADGVTIDCLLLQHRKPCVAFSLRNGNLTATCGCENDIRATMTMLLNRHLLGRASFQHNSGYDLVRNHYYATHCTCALKLNGPDAPPQEYKVRPFFHHLPQTPALDVQWTPGAPVILAQMLSEESIPYFTGKVVASPASPPTGGCATRVLVDLDVDDVSKAWITHHSILSIGTREDARAYDIFRKLF
ncbi:MAG: hypothetical protein RBS80_07680 [Thermoguttaceae bacterium]|jgi:hypothetical protein|nr:hypothetical protein [Thermoguttaceae bacterium]